MRTKIITCFLLTALTFGNNITAQTTVKKPLKRNPFKV